MAVGTKAWNITDLPLLSGATNLITGPSRTADVEQTIQLGAHGPRRLHVLLRAG
jgi:L-lactate utilization protein LutC